MVNIKLDCNTEQIELLMLNNNTWNHWNVGKQMRYGSFMNYTTHKLFA